MRDCFDERVSFSYGISGPFRRDTMTARRSEVCEKSVGFVCVLGGCSTHRLLCTLASISESLGIDRPKTGKYAEKKLDPSVIESQFLDVISVAERLGFDGKPLSFHKSTSES